VVKTSPFSFLDSPESSLRLVRIAVVRELLNKPIGASIAVSKKGKVVMESITAKHRARWQKALTNLKEPT